MNQFIWHRWNELEAKRFVNGGHLQGNQHVKVGDVVILNLPYMCYLEDGVVKSLLIGQDGQQE